MFKTRSRAVLQPPRQGGEPCPAALYETRPCFSGPCLTFDWAVRDGDIVCQRSDGTQVTGGCDGRPRPCVKPCTISNSECSREGVCACVPGFAPRYDDQSDGRRLRACVPMSSPAAAAAPGAQAAVDSSGHPSPPEDGELKARYYYPKDDEISIWMFAMIGIGCVFIVFVAVSIYLIHSSANANSRLQPQTMTVRQTQRTEAKP
ncbi:hypothetical protein B566_EDAN011377 [Ephemera danica]|nr:hypothetical protein B566_EDAN011377 [Ephemera danica]